MAHAQAAANQQKHIDDFNRAVMIQRLQAQQRPQGPPMGMVSFVGVFWGANCIFLREKSSLLESDSPGSQFLDLFRRLTQIFFIFRCLSCLLQCRWSNQ